MNFTGSSPTAAKSTDEGTIKANSTQTETVNRVVLSSGLRVIKPPIYIRPLIGQLYPRSV